MSAKVINTPVTPEPNKHGFDMKLGSLTKPDERNTLKSKNPTAPCRENIALSTLIQRI